MIGFLLPFSYFSPTFYAFPVQNHLSTANAPAHLFRTPALRKTPPVFRRAGQCLGYAGIRQQGSDSIKAESSCRQHQRCIYRLQFYKNFHR